MLHSFVNQLVTDVGSVDSSRRKQCGSVRSAERVPVRPDVVLRAHRRKAITEAVELLRIDRVDGEAPLQPVLDHADKLRSGLLFAVCLTPLPVVFFWLSSRHYKQDVLNSTVEH